MTLVVNFFGGPSCGKSTYAAGVFCELKKKQINAELVTEYAKDLVWEKRSSALKCQPYVFGKQLYKIEKLIDQTDVIITDSPLVLSVVYNPGYPNSFEKSVVEIFHSFNNMNLFIKRKDIDFESAGRNENLKQAVSIDEQIKRTLIENNITFELIDDMSLSIEYVCKKIIDSIDLQK
jgi:nicotinamide riboside kinase